MEDAKLVEFFKEAVQKAKEQGYDEKTIHASMHEASPKRVWQEKAYLALIDSAAINFAIFALVIIYFGSIFFNDKTTFYIFAFLLMSPVGLLYYFAHGAFEFHAGKKLLMSIVTSAILSSVAWFMYTLFNKLLAPIYVKLGTMQAELIKAQEVVKQAAAAGVNMPGASVIAQGGNVLAIFGNPPVVNTIAIIIIILLAYNFIPLLFYIKEKIVDADAIKVNRAKKQEQENKNKP